MGRIFIIIAALVAGVLLDQTVAQACLGSEIVPGPSSMSDKGLAMLMGASLGVVSFFGVNGRKKKSEDEDPKQ